MSSCFFHSLNHYVLFLQNYNFLFCLFLNLNLRLASSTIIIFKILICYSVIIYIAIWKKQISMILQNFPASTNYDRLYNIILYTLYNRLLSCILNILRVIDLSLILFNTSLGIYPIPKRSKYTAKFLSIN